MRRRICIIVVCMIFIAAALLLTACDSGAVAASRSASISEVVASTLSATPSNISYLASSVVSETSAAYAGEVVEIREKMFIAQTNEIYLNAVDYLGKTIKLEGLLKVAHDETTDSDFYYVVRFGPGCCGYDANPGFEVTWEKGYPEDDSWVEACGVLEYYVENGAKLLRLKLLSLLELETRGQEYVSQ